MEEKVSLKENLHAIFDGCMTVPNLLSVIRICLIPVFAVVYIKGYIWWSILILAVSGLSDFFDGKIARKFNQVSNLGKLLDPIADKLTIFAIAIVLFIKFKNAQSLSMRAFAWVFLLFIAKDIIMLVGGSVIIAMGMRPTPAEIYGKVATFVFYIVMLLILAFGPEVGEISGINPAYTLPEKAMFVLVVIAVILTFVALISYIPGAAKQILGKDKKEEK